MTILAKLKELLDANDVHYEVHSHRRAFTAQEVAAADHVPGREMAKVVMLRDDGQFFMAVLPAPGHVSLDRFAKAVGRPDMRLATETEFADLFPDCELGAMPPFGHLYGIPVWVDESLTGNDEITFNAGNSEQTVHMKYADFVRLAEPKIASFHAHAPVA